MIEQHLPEVSGPKPQRRWTTPVFVVFAVVAAVAALALVLEAVWLRPAYDDVRATAADKRAVISAAERFAVAANTYDASSMDQYEKSISPMLTTKFRTAYQSAMADLAKVVEAAKMKSEGQVLQSAVASLDTDTATVLVVADATVTTVYDTRDRHFRWQVKLVKVDGSWLIDNFDAVQ